MKTLLLALLPLLAFGQNQYGMQGNGFYGTAAIPSGAPWTGINEIRFEFRAHNCSTGGRIFQWEGFVARIFPTYATATSFYDSGSPTIHANIPAGVTDVIVRVQRSTTRWTIELWPANGSSYVIGDNEPATGVAVNLGSSDFNLMHDSTGGTTGAVAVLDWFRVYDSVVPLDSPPPSNTATGNLLNYELESNGADTSGNGISLSLAGTANWAATPVVPLVGEAKTRRAGVPFTIDCGATGATSYFWQQLSGPQTVTFSSRTAASTTVSGANAFGEYVLQCTAVNASGARGLSQVPIGVVATNASGVVLVASPEIATILGEMLRGEASPWPFYDRNRPRRSFEVGALLTTQMAASINTPLEGTVAIANGSTAVIGTGTLFLTRYAANSKILFYYDQGGGRIGRATARVISVASNTSMTLDSAWTRPSQTGIRHQRWGTGDGSDTDSAWAEGFNYYDNALAMYISYYKTGLSQLAVYADQIAQYWWLHANLGQNYNFAPRHISLEGLAIAAQRGALDANEVYAYIDNYNWSWPGGAAPGYRNYIGERNTSTNYQNFHFGIRESGYSWRHGVVLGHQHPNAQMRTTWQARLAANIQNHYRDFQCKASNPVNPKRCRFPDGAFRWEDTPYWGADITEQPWHTGVAMQGIIRYHRWTGNPVAQTVITSWVNHMMVNTQPIGAVNYPLYLDTVPSSFPGILCRSHFYWHLRGSETTLLQTGGDVGNDCTGPPESVYGSRDTSNEIISSYGYAFRLTGNAAIKTRGDNAFGGTWGADDGFFGQWYWRGAPNQGKTFGQGLCCNDSYLVDRLGPVLASKTPQLLPIQVGFRLQSVPGSARVRLTVVRPDGQQASAECTSSPCSVSGDQQQGEHRFQLEYLTSGGAVLNVSDLHRLRVGS